MQYYYVVDKMRLSAECFKSLKEAKKAAFERKSLIYTNKASLPESVKYVGGICKYTLRRNNGKFAKKFAVRYFNEDMKGE